MRDRLLESRVESRGDGDEKEDGDKSSMASERYMQACKEIYRELILLF